MLYSSLLLLSAWNNSVLCIVFYLVFGLIIPFLHVLHPPPPPPPIIAYILCYKNWEYKPKGFQSPLQYSNFLNPSKAVITAYYGINIISCPLTSLFYVCLYDVYACIVFMNVPILYCNKVFELFFIWPSTRIVNPAMATKHYAYWWVKTTLVYPLACRTLKRIKTALMYDKSCRTLNSIFPWY